MRRGSDTKSPLVASTVQKILNNAGLGLLRRAGRATRTPPKRYVRERPGELVHVDVKKLASIPDGGDCRTLPPDPTRRMGLHATLDLTKTTHNSPQRLPALLQSTQNHSTLKRGHLRIHHRIQPMRNTQLATCSSGGTVQLVPASSLLFCRIYLVPCSYPYSTHGV